MTKSPTMIRPRVAVLGGGRLAQTVAGMFSGVGASVTLWARRKPVRTQLARANKAWHIADTPQAACETADLVIPAVPADALREVMTLYGDVARGDQIVLHGIRGVEPGFILPQQVVREETCIRKIGVLGGPLFAPELHEGLPVSAVVASRYEEVVQTLSFISEVSALYLHASSDPVGVEVIGAISNVTALAVGVSNALGMGETARGVLLTHGLADAARLGMVLGAKPVTFAGLAGIGDMIPRKVASTDRHYELGAAIAAGKRSDELGTGRRALEGVVTAQAAVELAQKHAIKLPLVEAVDTLCHGAEECDAREVLSGVLRSDLDLDRAFGGR